MGLLCAAAIILGYVESLFPVFAGVPGMKIGLPNLAVVMVLYVAELVQHDVVNGTVRILHQTI